MRKLNIGIHFAVISYTDNRKMHIIRFYYVVNQSDGHCITSKIKNNKNAKAGEKIHTTRNSHNSHAEFI